MCINQKALNVYITSRKLLLYGSHLLQNPPSFSSSLLSWTWEYIYVLVKATHSHPQQPDFLKRSLVQQNYYYNTKWYHTGEHKEAILYGEKFRGPHFHSLAFWKRFLGNLWKPQTLWASKKFLPYSTLPCVAYLCQLCQVNESTETLGLLQLDYTQYIVASCIILPMVWQWLTWWKQEYSW